LKTKTIMKIIIIPLFAISLLLNGYFLYGHLRHSNYIESSIEHTVNTANLELANAYQSLVYKVDDDNEKLIRTLIAFQIEFENASNYIETYIDYYNLKNKSLDDPLKIKFFFESYIDTSHSWVNALIIDDSENTPTVEEVNSFVEDVKNVISKFSVYEGAEGNSEIDIVNSSYDELMEVVDEIYSEVKSTNIKEYLSKRNFENIK